MIESQSHRTRDATRYSVWQRLFSPLCTDAYFYACRQGDGSAGRDSWSVCRAAIDRRPEGQLGKPLEERFSMFRVFVSVFTANHDRKHRGKRQVRRTLWNAFHPKAFAMRNAAEAASPPTITVWAALRTGLPVVNKPLM